MGVPAEATSQCWHGRKGAEEGPSLGLGETQRRCSEGMAAAGEEGGEGSLVMDSLDEGTTGKHLVEGNSQGAAGLQVDGTKQEVEGTVGMASKQVGRNC